jgi:hypothetical protein
MIEAFTLVAPREDVASGHEESVPLFVRKPHPPRREIPNALGTKNHLSPHHASRQTRRNAHDAHFCAKRHRFPRRSILARASFSAISHFSAPKNFSLSLHTLKRARASNPSQSDPHATAQSVSSVRHRAKERKKETTMMFLKTNERTWNGMV